MYAQETIARAQLTVRREPRASHLDRHVPPPPTRRVRDRQLHVGPGATKYAAAASSATSGCPARFAGPTQALQVAVADYLPAAPSRGHVLPRCTPAAHVHRRYRAGNTVRPATPGGIFLHHGGA